MSGTYVWDRKYTIVYASNDGAENTSEHHHDHDLTAVLAGQTEFSRAGYRLTGWNTAANGNGTSYALESSVSQPLAQRGGSITLYAQWELAEAVLPQAGTSFPSEAFIVLALGLMTAGTGMFTRRRHFMPRNNR